jgi:hypothetical protein
LPDGHRMVWAGLLLAETRNFEPPEKVWRAAAGCMFRAVNPA